MTVEELEKQVLEKAADILARVTALVDRHADWLARESGVPREVVAEALVEVAVKWALAHGAKGARAEWLAQQLGAAPRAEPTVN